MEDALYTRILQYLNIRPRSEKEIRDYIAKQLQKPKVRKLFERQKESRITNYDVRGVIGTPQTEFVFRNDKVELDEKSIADHLVTRLKQAKFLDDMQFALWFIRSRTNFKPKGRRLITLELQQKGLEKEFIEQAFIAYDAEQIEQSEPERDEVNLARELLEKKRKKYEGMDRQERFNKAGSMLARRGFDLDAIRRAIDAVFEK